MAVPAASVAPPKALQWVGQAVSQPQAATTQFDVDLLAADWHTAWPQAQPLTLEDTLILAFANDLSLTMAKWEQNKASAVQKEALAALLPNLELSYTQSRFQGGVQVFDGVPNKARISTIRPEVRLLLPINLGGRDIFAYKQAGAKAATQGYITQALQQETLASVAKTYLDLLATYLQHELSRQTQKEAKQQLALSQARFDEGIGVMIDVLESRSALEREQRTQVALEQDVAKLSAQLTPLLGLAENTLLKPNLAQALTFSFLAEPLADTLPSGSVAPLDAEMGAPPPYQPADATYTALVERAMAQTYSLKQAAEAQRAAELALKKTVANALPTVNLSTYANLIGKDADDLMSSRFAGVEVSMKLLEGLGLKVYSQIKQAQADVAMTKLAREQAERSVRAQVAEALSAYRTAHKQLSLADMQLATAEKARHQTMGRYEEGVGNYLEVLTSATQLQQARAAVVSLTLQSKQAELALATAVGDLKPKLMTALGLVDEPLATAKKAKPAPATEFAVPPVQLTQYQPQADALAPLRLPPSKTANKTSKKPLL
jgi:outer membrane protein TolC